MKYVDPISTRRIVSDGGVQAPIIQNNVDGLAEVVGSGISTFAKLKERQEKVANTQKQNLLNKYKLEVEKSMYEHKKKLVLDKNYKYDTKNHNLEMEKANNLKQSFLKTWREQGFEESEIEQQIFDIDTIVGSTDINFKKSYLEMLEQKEAEQFQTNLIMTKEIAMQNFALGNQQDGVRGYESFIRDIKKGIDSNLIAPDKGLKLMLDSRKDFIESRAISIINDASALPYDEKMTKYENLLHQNQEEFTGLFPELNINYKNINLTPNIDDKNKFESIIRSTISAERSRESVRLEKAQLSNYLKEIKKQDNINLAIESKDPYKLSKVLNDRNLTTEEFINDTELQKTLYGKTIADFGNPFDSSVGVFINDTSLKDLKERIGGLKGDGHPSSVIAREAIYPFVQEMAGDDEVKKTALLKQLGTEIYNYNPVTLMKGEDNPKYFEVNDAIRVGRGAVIDSNLFRKFKWGNDKSPNTRYNTLLESMGGSNPINKQILDNYINGTVKTTNDLVIEGFYKTDPNIAIDRFLENDDYFKSLLDGIPIVKDLSTASKYKKSNFIINYNIKKIESAPPGNTEAKTEDGDYYEFF